MLSRRPTLSTALPPDLTPVTSSSYSLLRVLKKPNPCRINNMEPLFKKHPGWRVQAQTVPGKINNLQTLLAPPVRKAVTVALIESICNPFPFRLLQIPILVNPLFSQPSALPGGVAHQNQKPASSQIMNPLWFLFSPAKYSDAFKPFDFQRATVHRRSRQLECL